jgi:hypothetical protein
VVGQPRTGKHEQHDHQELFVFAGSRLPIPREARAAGLAHGSLTELTFFVFVISACFAREKSAKAA